MILKTAPSELSPETVRQTHGKELEAIARYRRVANYLAAAQLYLKSNVLLEEPLRPEHIKDRLLGHWGTCPGINLVYAHLNALIRRYDVDAFLVTGPGHGAPANLANLYLEGSLQPFYPELTLDLAGLERFVKRFSWPGGFPSHLYAGIPGTIHEGGELGYALATAFGAAMDNPDLIVTCIVGDGEAETGPTATAWHSYKFIDPAESGAVLPILHLNGYKISEPTIYGTMSNEELSHLFTGYGYQVEFVEGDDLDAQLYGAMDWTYQEIRRIQQAARAGQPIAQPRWPLIILRSLKGWTGIKEMDGEPIEGSFRSHQVPAADAKTNPAHLQLVEQRRLSVVQKSSFFHASFWESCIKSRARKNAVEAFNWERPKRRAEELLPSDATSHYFMKNDPSHLLEPLPLARFPRSWKDPPGSGASHRPPLHAEHRRGVLSIPSPSHVAFQA